MQKVSSVFSTSWWMDSVALYGSTTVSETWTHKMGVAAQHAGGGADTSSLISIAISY